MLSEENIVEPDEIPYENIHQWCIGVDYGTGNSTVFELAGKTDDGEVYVCKEYYFAGRLEAQANGDYDAQKTDLEFSEDMKRFITENYNLTERVYRSGPNGMPIVVDPAAASFILQLRRHRMKVTKADNSVLDGIRTVASMLGAKKLKISNECSNLIDEMHGYMWDSKAQAIGVDKPIKQNDHACDALRYLMMKFKDGTKISNATRNVGW